MLWKTNNLPPNRKKEVFEETFLKKKKTKTTMHVSAHSCSDEDKEDFCLVYMSNFTQNKSGEQWVQCVEFHMWAHKSRTNKELRYMWSKLKY